MLDFFKICGRITQVSGCSAGGRALEWGSRGREFESRHSDHKGTVAMIQIATVLFNYSL